MNKDNTTQNDVVNQSDNIELKQENSTREPKTTSAGSLYGNSARHTASYNSNRRMKKKKKKPIGVKIAIVVVVLVVVGSIGYSIANSVKQMKKSMKDIQASANTDDLYKIKRQDVEQEITTTGTITGMKVNAITSPVNAKVDEVYAEVGQTVKAGDVLLTYDASELGENLSKVQIQAQTETASSGETYENVATAKKKVKDAQKKVNSLKDKLETQKEAAESINDQILAQQDLLEEMQTRNTKEETNAATPNEEGTTRAPKLEDTKPLVANIRALNKQLTRKNEQIAETESDLAEQKGIVSANKDMKVSKSTKAQINASKRLSNQNINDAQKSLAKAQAGITADKDGIIQSVEVVKGAYASESQTLFTIIDAEQIGVEFAISKDNLGSITEGQQARITIGSKEYSGEVTYISRVAAADVSVAANAASTANSGGTIKGRILIDNPDEDLYIGVAAKVYIFVGKAENALTIPYEALCTDVKGDYVYTVDKKNIVKRNNIKTGLYSDEYYEVTDGVKEGDKIITNVTKNVKEGEEYVPEEEVPSIPGLE